MLARRKFPLAEPKHWQVWWLRAATSRRKIKSHSTLGAGLRNIQEAFHGPKAQAQIMVLAVKDSIGSERIWLLLVYGTFASEAMWVSSPLVLAIKNASPNLAEVKAISGAVPAVEETPPGKWSSHHASWKGVVRPDKHATMRHSSPYSDPKMIADIVGWLTERPHNPGATTLIAILPRSLSNFFRAPRRRLARGNSD